jgi:hypothetical protein
MSQLRTALNNSEPWTVLEMFLQYRGLFAIDPGAKLKTKGIFHE